MATACVTYIVSYGVKIPVTIGSSNGLLPDGTKPLPEPIDLQISDVLFHSSECISSMEMTKISVIEMCLKIAYLKLQLHIPRYKLLIKAGS